MERIHLATLDALEQIGLADAPQSGIDVMVGVGAILDDDGRLRFPRALVEDMLAKAAKSITLYGRDPKHDMQIGGHQVYYGTAGAAVHMVDVLTHDYRDSTVQDLHDAARIADVLDNIHFVQRPMVARDIDDNCEMDLNTVYATVTGTSKHVGTSFFEPGFVADGVELLHMVAGSEAAWRARPFVSISSCFVVPPMRFATDACLVMERCIEAGFPTVVRRSGRRHRARLFGRCSNTGRGRMSGRCGLCQRYFPRLSGDLRHLAVCIGPTHRRDVWRIWRTGVADRRKQEILARPSRAMLDPALDTQIRARFNIHL